MEVTTAPAKWDLLKKHKNLQVICRERACRIRAAAVDFTAGAGQPTRRDLNDLLSLDDSLSSDPPPGTSRLYVVEDLSREVIERLGMKLDIDPLFFREQINDYW